MSKLVTLFFTLVVVSCGSTTNVPKQISAEEGSTAGFVACQYPSTFPSIANVCMEGPPTDPDAPTQAKCDAAGGIWHPSGSCPTANRVGSCKGYSEDNATLRGYARFYSPSHSMSQAQSFCLSSMWLGHNSFSAN